MAPTEATILQNYLLLPARLPSIISLEQFTSYFPKSQQSSPQIRALYRDLQQQRNAVVDSVAQNIDSEVKLGRSLRRAVAQARRETEEEEQDDEIDIERNLFGFTSNTILPKKHNLTTILPEMESAANDIEQETRKLEEEEAALLESVKQTVGGMSDLRYGRLANSKLRYEVLEGLNAIQEVCKRKL
ncbi:Cnl2/NKP2 family protein-domain-containing protein [Pseudomassariella vexata]|uniref:Cnl2/NKP2 family protein-domain-containing protein n=1 Tax=Pseudomassariella vexata TaxID=1141098 RepID=A0A1Y2DLB4_9PEZI|nr:Cnl2/NKP2 family protein-domain-containing protein [Pseudomassariella vexata]ORY60108.1 Cnl2/NKP2 family protein-domain-containing protein [Pseudomassariella vexata]